MEPYLRGVIEDPLYQQDLDNFRRLYPEIDEVQRLLGNELSAHPTAGIPWAIAPDFRAYKTSAYRSVPPFWIVYRFDETTVTLLSIKIADEE
jgi:hypothetical protein